MNNKGAGCGVRAIRFESVFDKGATSEVLQCRYGAVARVYFKATPALIFIITFLAKQFVSLASATRKLPSTIASTFSLLSLTFTIRNVNGCEWQLPEVKRYVRANTLI